MGTNKQCVALGRGGCETAKASGPSLPYKVSAAPPYRWGSTL